MKLNIIAEVWLVLKDSIISTDIDYAADNLVDVLINNDFSPAEIKSAFRMDHSVIQAVKSHMEDSITDTDDEEYVVDDDIDGDFTFEDFDDEDDDY